MTHRNKLQSDDGLLSYRTSKKIGHTLANIGSHFFSRLAASALSLLQKNTDLWKATYGGAPIDAAPEIFTAPDIQLMNKIIDHADRYDSLLSG